MSFLNTRSANFKVVRPVLSGLALLLLLWTFAPIGATAQMKNDHVSWKLLTPEIKGKPGDKAEIQVQATIVPKAHMYTTKKYPDSVLGPQPTEVTVGGKNIITRSGSVRGSKAAKKVVDPNFDDLTTEFWEGTVTLTVPVKIAKNAKPGEGKGWVNFYFMTCNDKLCRPSTDQRFEVKVVVEEDSTNVDTTAVAGADTNAIDADTNLAEQNTEDTTNKAATLAVAGMENGGGSGSINEQIEDAKSKGLIIYLLMAMGFGFAALVTPCVYPMVPITVSFFTKREQATRLRAVRDASIYGLGIILTFTALGAIVAAVYGPTGMGKIATDPIINLFIATIFVAFALSLFGLFEIQIPSGILNKLNTKASQGEGVTSILLMSFVFSLTSFTCTVPFAGNVLAGMGEGGDWFWPMAGMAAFAFAFSIPFFLLALFPSWLKSMPKSGGWLNAVKVIMGFVEIAAAMKFLSNSDVIWNWGILTREIVLAVWISISLLAALYLLGRYRLSHDTPIEKIGTIRLLFAMGFLTVGFWFLTGLFGGRLGEVDAFLPPQEYPGKGNTSILAGLMESGGASHVAASMPADSGNSGVTWVKADGMSWIQDDYQAALAESKRTGKPVFVDFTGYTCTNCRWMERNVFTRSDVRDLMNQYVLARLYTDRREESNQINRQMQIDRFKTIDLPFYALFSTEDKVMGQTVFSRDVEEFKDFLKRGLQGTTVAAASTTSEKREGEIAVR